MLATRMNRGLNDLQNTTYRDFDMLVNRLFHGQENGGFAPWGVDIREDADHFYVDAELPGFRKEDVEITLENSTLTVSAERKIEPKAENDGGNYLLNERRYTRFLRSFTLPPTIDEKSVQASLKDGVLTISLNKREEVKPRKINVS